MNTKKITKKPVSITLDDANKELVQQFNKEIEKAKYNAERAQVAFNALVGQRSAMLSAIVNMKGHNGLQFNLDENLNLVEVLPEETDK